MNHGDTQRTAYERFLALHRTDRAFVMPNAWDGASAALLADAGFQALGSSSGAIAFGLGRLDGVRAVTREAAIANAAVLGAASGLPVNGDLEDGFGGDPEDCAATVEAAIAAGLAGLGIEDTTADRANPIHGFDHAVRRVRAAALAASGRIVLTGRTDNFIQGRPDLEDTIRRLTAFADAGADVLFAPGLPDLEAIRTVAAAVSPKPLNVMFGPSSGFASLDDLSDAGVRRVSLGGLLYVQSMSTLRQTAERLVAGDLAAAKPDGTGRRIVSLLTARNTPEGRSGPD
jgi:2-methylisocitrate lyase-like PEP mutase family enzyme